MKAFTAIVGVLIFTAICMAEIIPINITSRSGETKCIQDTLSSSKDTIRVTIDKEVMLDNVGIFVVLTAVAGATDSFFCTGDPKPGGKLEIARWDSTTDKFKGLSSFFFTKDTTTVNFDAVAPGSLPIPITFRDSTGASVYPLNWYDGRRHYPFVLASEAGSGKEGWNPPFSSTWDFVVWLGGTADRAVLQFCVVYKFDK